MPRAINGRKICTKCRVEKGVEEFSKRNDRSDFLDGHCRLCKSANYHKNSNYWVIWAQNNPDKCKKATDKYQKKHIAERDVRNIKFRKKNPDYDRNWNKVNSDKRCALSSKRRACQLQATPPWLTTEHYRQILQFYTTAKILTQITGIEFVVDHIMPLQGKTVHGLHVPWNLQVLTFEDNGKKFNKII